MFAWGALAGRGVLPGLLASLNWFVWAALIAFLVGFHHNPPLDDVTPLSPGRRLLGVVCLLLIVLLTPPVLMQDG